MYDIKEIKEKITVPDYLRRMGIHVEAGRRCVSPLRPGAKNPTSFWVDKDRWYDFGSAMGGDVIDLAAELCHNSNKGAAIRELAGITGVQSSGVDYSHQWAEYTHQMNAFTAKCQTELTDEDYGYLQERGLNRDDVERLKIGRIPNNHHLAGRLMLPYFKNGYVCYYATRAMPGGSFPDSKYMKQKRDDYCQHIPWGMQTLDRHGDTLVISEGYFDAAVWEREGYPVLSPITGNFSKEQWPDVISACKMFKRVLIIFDNDDISHAGETFTERTAKRLFQNRIKFMVGHTPHGVKDVNDYYTGGGSLQKLVDTATEGKLFMAQRCRDAKELQDFILSINRYTTTAEIAELLSNLDLPAEVKKAIRKIADSPPNETRIVDDIARKHRLLFVENDGFYEWTGKIWTKLSDFVIEGYAGEEYGPTFKTAARMKAIRQHLYSQCLANVEFNKLNVMNFPNGTLELDTGVFREHRETDYCSFMQSYHYDPSAQCPQWVKFINEITDDDPKREDALQTIMGYVMLADCRYQLMFLLMGKGGNGKSVYLDVMRELFGAENCTTVDPDRLNDSFQRILLRDSLVNYASEISGDMTATVKWVKQITCGEQINGCYKGKDTIDFTTRCKMIFACNTSPKTSVIEGLDRRLFFVDFPCKFVDFPDPSDPKQRPADRDIIPKLLKELPGIFNWAYAGYKMLNAVKYFTETDEQQYYMQRFKETSNPVVVFCEEMEYRFRGTLIKSDIYDLYSAWCERNGHKRKASNNFFADFCSIMENKIENNNYRPRMDDGTRQRCVIFK